MINPKIANSQMLVAVVNPNILSEPFIKAPAPKKPMLVTIAASKDTVKLGPISTEVIAKPHAPTATKTKVPNPTGLWLFWRCKPYASVKRNTKKNLRIISLINIGNKIDAAFLNCLYFTE